MQRKGSFYSGVVPLFSCLSVALMVQLRAAFLWQSVKGFSPDLTSYTNLHPFGTPLDPPETLESYLFLGEETSVGKDVRRSGGCGETQSKSGLSGGYLHRVTSSSGRLWAGWRHVRRNVWISVAYTNTP